MTDTDDTDDLLLIPPDFFSVKSDSDLSDVVQPYYSIVDNLIRQVGNLQSRIRSIESSESFFSNSLEYSFEESHDMHNSVRGFRKFNSSDELYDSKSTSEKNSPNFKVKSMPNTPYSDRFASRASRSPYRHPFSPKSDGKRLMNDKGDNNTLNEIDTFLSKVKTIQRLNAVRNLESEFNTSIADTDASLMNEKPVEEKINKHKTWQCGDNSESVLDLGAGVKSTLYKTEPPNKDAFNVKYYDLDTTGMNDTLTSERYPSSESSTDSTQITAYKKTDKNDSLLSNPIHSNAINILNRHKKLLEDSAHKREPKPRTINTLSNNLGLMNLADIWGDSQQLNDAKAVQKLQEEKLRRQHCENLIHELQNRNLELQQKLSVAVQVDESKNKVINQFQEALDKIMAKMKASQRDRKDWEGEINALKNKHKEEMEDMSQKILYYEKELSKALKLVQVNQEKATSFEHKFSDLQNKLQFIERRYQDCEDILKKETDRNKQLTEILSQKEIDLNENKNVVNNARSEVSKSKKAIENCQEEFLKLKEEHDKLQQSFTARNEKIQALEEEIRRLAREKEEFKKREEFLQDEIIKMKKQLDNNKVELRNFYQGQVEILVQNKLKEFQSQLDQAESGFKEEMKKREMSVAKTAATHIQQISDKFSMEINLLEKKHQEEIKLYQVQLMREKQQIESLQMKIDQFHAKRIHIAKELQKIMETQWTEAFKIITNSKSPTFQDSFSTIDQLNSLKTRSYSNVEEILAQQAESLDLKGIEKDCSLDENVVNNATSNKTKSKTQEHREDEVQKYVNLLLNKPSNATNSGEFSKLYDRMVNDEKTSTFSSLEQDYSGTGFKYSRDKRSQKPPWK